MKMVMEKSKHVSSLIWVLVALLFAHNLLIPVMSRTIEHQKNDGTSPLEERKCNSCPDPHAGTPPTDPHHGSGGSTPPSHGLGGSTPPSHGSGGSTPPSHGSGGSTPPSHGSGGSTPPSHGSYDPTPSTPSNCRPSSPSTPHHTPTPSTPHHTPTPSTPSGGGGGYYPSPPTTPSTPISITPPTPISITPPTTPIDPGTPSIPGITPTPPFLPDPSSNPFACNYWRNHPTLIWGLVGWWGTLGNSFSVPSVPGFGSNMNLLQALSNSRTDGYGALYREGTASLLNSMTTRRFPFTTNEVRQNFISALSSNKAAAAQAHVFKLANEGKLKPRT